MNLWSTIKQDVAIALERDPAARSAFEVLLTYPGVHAIIVHRFNHQIWQANFKLLARWIAHVTRLFTGIEIHPGATIGQRVFIDHGMGVVIGETAEIHDDVTMYHGVTLGGTSLKKVKRHPTIESHVVLGAGCNILGPVTIGHHTRIGAGSVVISDVPDHCTVVGIPGRIVQRRGLQDEAEALDHGNLPDPSAMMIEQMTSEIKTLKEQVAELNEKVFRMGPSTSR